MQLKTVKISLTIGIISVVIGLITYYISWEYWDFFGGLMPGYSVLLFPGNLSLEYMWHPLFSEEIDLIPKLCLLLIGQFTVVSTVVAICISLYNKLLSKG